MRHPVPIRDQKLLSAVNAALPRGAEWRGLARNGTAQEKKCKTNPPIPPTQPPRTLTPRKIAAIALLIGGHSVASAARSLGIGRRTLFRWLTHADFRAELNQRLEALPSLVRPQSAQSAGPARIPAQRSLAVYEDDDDDRIDPEQIRRDIEFCRSIVADAQAERAARGTQWHGLARNGAVSPEKCKTNPPLSGLNRSSDPSTRTKTTASTCRPADASIGGEQGS